MYDCVKNVFTIDKDDGKFSLVPLLDTTLSKRSLSIGSRFELVGPKRMDYQHGQQACVLSRKDLKRQRKLKWKSMQAEKLEDMYVKNQFGVYVLNPGRCSSSL